MMHETVEQTLSRTEKVFCLIELFKSTHAILYMGMDICSKTLKLSYKSRFGTASALFLTSSGVLPVNRVKPLKP